MKRFLQIFGLIAVLFTLLPLVATDYWWIRIFDYPHIQLTLLTFAAIGAYFIRFDIKWLQDYIFMGVLITCFAFQFSKIYPFTPLAPYQIGESSSEAEKEISVFAANVLQENKEYEKMLREINRFDADIVVLTETDRLWQKEMWDSLKEIYDYRVEIPLDNTYGMLLYSRYELVQPQVRYLVDDSIPSIHSRVKIPQGEEIQLYAIHPTPPMPQHNPRSTDRDAEMMKIAQMSRESELPVIVTGDFNDVAWSNTTSLFQRVSTLLDVRVGRGFYNTFNANSFLLRWSIDHLFASPEFRVKKITLGDHIGSDHFPFYASLTLEPERAAEQEPKKPSPEELKQAWEIIKKEENSED